MTSAQVNAYIRKHYKEQDDHQLAKRFKMSVAAIQSRRLRMGLHVPLKLRVSDQPLEEEIAERSEKQEKKENKRRYNELFARLARVERERDAAVHIAQSPLSEAKIRPLSKLQGEATIVALLSDMHIEETVKPETVNGLSEYTLAIAERRMKQYFTTLLHLIQIEQQTTKIDHLVLALLGDAISGDIHEELLETCSLTPMEAIVLAQEWIAQGIDYLLENSKLKLTIVCHSGNHARTTKKVRPSTEAGHSVEYLMYNNLAWHYAKEKRITWIIPKSYLSHLTIYDQRLVFHHGHMVKYGGGVGGITISMNKAIAQWNRTRPADIYVSGHFHSVFDGGNFVVNGSMIGYSPFAVAIKAAYEAPAQVMFAIHSKLGKYLSRTIKFS